jgi:hypothetical protein
MPGPCRITGSIWRSWVLGPHEFASRRARGRGFFNLVWWVAVVAVRVVVRVCLTVFTSLAKMLPPQNSPHAFASALTVTAALCGEPEPVTSAEQEKAAE